MDEEMDILNSQEDFLSQLKEAAFDEHDAVATDYLISLKYPPIEDFQNGLEWFNVSEPLSFATHLKRKIVLLDFFTYCCINCMHILPDLKDIENDFSVEDGLVVVGVHSAKFENEKQSKNIMAAVQRYNISHPVVNDRDNVMWRNCKVCCWPTLLLLGPNAKPIVMFMGEGHKDELQLLIRNALTFYKTKKLISNDKIPFKSAFHFLPDLKGPLLFPGKITSYIDSNGNSEMLAISDTGNHRILITQSDGEIIHQIGGSSAGFKDGNFEEVLFNAPQGLVFANAYTLYVADTENHAIRTINLNKSTVTTIVGSGEQGCDFKGGSTGFNQEISSPWDVCMYTFSNTQILLIAMAGLHQIWALFFDNIQWWRGCSYLASTCIAIAGSGREENRNNLYCSSASFAQPSGLAVSESTKELFIADSESSTVRKISLVDGKVSAVVGGDINPQNLFAFGDKDGKQYEAKLQHPLGVTTAKTKDIVFVADTYNHKIKKINIHNNTISTMVISANFNEPGGLCMSANDKRLYVADTNNHSIKILHLDDNLSVIKVEEMHLKFSSNVSHSSVNRSVYDVYCNSSTFVNIKGGKMILGVTLEFANGITLTNGAPQSWKINLPDSSWSCIPTSDTNVFNVDSVLSIPSAVVNKTVNIDILYKLVICKSDTCMPKQFIIRLPITFSETASIAVESNVKFLLDQSKIVFKHKY
ncbi:hypothetical protein FQA39_LY00822 [Lamprigera yunnana]|nr:hypothetical protein FQA39_LY00822 [Lamprigera yunnana]